ncbi:hypothetical protein MCOR07_006050, partial [Pyricularia oryzae]
GCLHDELRLYHLASPGSQGSVRGHVRLVPRLQVLPGAGQVRDADAQRGIDARAEAEVGLGSGAAGLLEKPRVSKFGYEGFGGCGSEAIDFFFSFLFGEGTFFFVMNLFCL